MRDPRYSTAAWRRTRTFVIARAGGRCEVEGPRCTGRATTCHHVLPSSQYPERFFDPANLQAACAPCNRHGAATASENRNNRMTIAYLEQLVEEQRIEIERLAGELAETNAARPRRVPQIR